MLFHLVAPQQSDQVHYQVLPHCKDRTLVTFNDFVAGYDVLKHQIGFVLSEPADAEIA